jgi:hypothetical protein
MLMVDITVNLNADYLELYSQTTTRTNLCVVLLGFSYSRLHLREIVARLVTSHKKTKKKKKRTSQKNKNNNKQNTKATSFF